MVGTPPDARAPDRFAHPRSEEHTSELQSHDNLVCRLLLEKKTRHRDKMRNGEGGSGKVTRYLVRRLALRLPQRATPLVVRAWQCSARSFVVLFFNNPAPPEIYPFPQPDALPI